MKATQNTSYAKVDELKDFLIEIQVTEIIGKSIHLLKQEMTTKNEKLRSDLHEELASKFSAFGQFPNFSDFVQKPELGEFVRKSELHDLTNTIKQSIETDLIVVQTKQEGFVMELGKLKIELGSIEELGSKIASLELSFKDQKNSNSELDN